MSFTSMQGQSLGVVGETGSGKTMTALALLRLFDPAIRVRLTGTALFDGRDLLRMNGRELRQVRGGQIGIVFQDPLTSAQPGAARRRADRRVGPVAPASAARRPVQRAIDLMERVGIPIAAAAPTTSRTASAAACVNGS